MDLKRLIRDTLNWFHLDLTRNLRYDRLTKLVLKKSLSNNSNCIDVGAHKGEILEVMLKFAPQGRHFAFEPIPSFYNDLVKTFGRKSTILPFALSDSKGESTFQFVKNKPAYSGIKRRRYDFAEPDIEEIKVGLERLDDVIPAEVKFDLIKIDVEGAKLYVLKGSVETIFRSKPLVLFEFGQGGADYYDYTPEEMFDFLNDELKLKISLLDAWLKKQLPLSRNQFIEVYHKSTDYYFLAHP